MNEIKCITSLEELYKSKDTPTGEIIVDAVVDYVKRVKSHSAEDVATFLGQKRVWLSGAMQMLVGMPLQEFILQWRVLQAIDLLDDPGLSVSEVSNLTGFRNEKNLVDTLRRRMGITPYAYRTGTVIRNSNYSFNRDPHSRKKLIENVKSLKSYRQESTSEAE